MKKEIDIKNNAESPCSYIGYKTTIKINTDNNNLNTIK